jgi:hypothetical protein
MHLLLRFNNAINDAEIYNAKNWKEFRSGRGLTRGSIPELAQRDSGKPQNSLITITALKADIWNRDFPYERGLSLAVKYLIAVSFW